MLKLIHVVFFGLVMTWGLCNGLVIVNSVVPAVAAVPVSVVQTVVPVGGFVGGAAVVGGGFARGGFIGGGFGRGFGGGFGGGFGRRDSFAGDRFFGPAGRRFRRTPDFLKPKSD